MEKKKLANTGLNNKDIDCRVWEYPEYFGSSSLETIRGVIAWRDGTWKAVPIERINKTIIISGIDISPKKPETERDKLAAAIRKSEIIIIFFLSNRSI